MARNFEFKPTAKITKKQKEGAKIYSPASWRGKPKRRAVSTR